MKRFLLLCVLLTALLAGGGALYLRAHPETVLPEPVDALLQRVRDVAEHAAQRFAPSREPTGSATPTRTPGVARAMPPKASTAPKKSAGVSAATPPAPLKDPVTLYLTNGGVVTGELVSETPQEVILRWEYGEVGFQRAEIRQLVKGKQDTDDDHVTLPWEGEHQKVNWPHQHDVVVKLMKGTVVDAQIVKVTPESILLAQTLPGGGAVEQTIARADVEELAFRPIQNERSAQIAENLKAVFPAMHWYQEGMFTIVTDSAPPAVKEYRRTIRELATDWYLAFYPLLAQRTPNVQQHVVIFENWDSYIEYAATDGVPGWLAVGYFHPQEEVLYCFNMVGERFSELLSDVYLGQFRQARDQVSGQIKGQAYELSIEGQMSEFLQKLESAHAMVRQLFQQISVDILRHELTHAMFHNWRLQGIVLSQMPEQSREELEKKRKYLQAENVEDKRKLLDELVAQEAKEDLPDLQASNSWFVEGLAGYLEPWPVGGINQERLAELQEARRRQQILPLEFLNVFRIGSFPGMATQSALYAYAQSWALCHFLMHRYPDGFLAYLDRVAREQPKADEDTLTWLLEALGKEQRPLEQEFLAYLDQFPPEDPFWLKQMQSFIDLRSELSALASRLWGS